MFDTLLQQHIIQQFNYSDINKLKDDFARDGFIKIPQIVPKEIFQLIQNDANHLLNKHSERRDIILQTTGDTPRHMFVVRSEQITEHSQYIKKLYDTPILTKTLEKITKEPLLACPKKDEEFLITKQVKKGDTHGWHWGDFSFALIWILQVPDIQYGGMLQCIPHTHWNKKDPGINRYLCERKIDTYGFVTGDLYLLRTDTTLHRTIPLNADVTRIILNMTWASTKDLTETKQHNDRWWDNANAEAATKQ